MTEVIQLLDQLVRIDSINPDLVPDGAGEGEVATFIERWFNDNGFEVIVQEAAPKRPNVIGIARGAGGGRNLMFNGHMDVVGLNGMTNAFEPRIEGRRMYGRGAYDMKAGVAAAMIAAKRAKSMNLRGDVVVACVVDEEVASIGTEEVVRELQRFKPDAAIVCEPTEMELCIAHRGFVWLEIETFGKAAHGSRPRDGIDAVAKMGKVLIELEKLDLRLRANPTHELLGSGSLHASTIQGGQDWSSYPAQCKLQVERRTLPGDTSKFVLRQIRDILDGLSVIDPDFKAEVKHIFSRFPLQANENDEIIQLTREHAMRVTNKTPNTVGAPFWTDAALLANAGVSSFLFGPHGEGAHAAIEWVDLDTVEQCVEIYASVAAEFCK